MTRRVVVPDLQPSQHLRFELAGHGVAKPLLRPVACASIRGNRLGDRRGRALDTEGIAPTGVTLREPSLDDELADRFVSMYVNELTEDYGEEGRRAVRELLRRGEEIGAFTEPVNVEFVGS